MVIVAVLQVLTWVLSYDGENSPEPLAITAAGAALAVSGVCFMQASAALPSAANYSLMGLCPITANSKCVCSRR